MVGGAHTVNVNSGADRERRAMLRLQVDHRGAVENRGARAGIFRRMMIRVRESGDCEIPQFPRPVENKSRRDGIFAIQQIFVLADIATINDAAGGGPASRREASPGAGRCAAVVPNQSEIAVATQVVGVIWSGIRAWPRCCASGNATRILQRAVKHALMHVTNRV